MRGLAAYIMRGRLQAVIAIATIAMLSLLFPPLGLVSAAAVGLVTLRLGIQDTLVAAAGAIGLTGLMAMLAFGSPIPIVSFVVGLWLPALALALVLRSTRSLAATFEASLAIGILVVVVIYLATNDPAEWWLGVLDQTLRPALIQAGLSLPEKELSLVLSEAAGLMTGMLAATLLLGQLAALLIARWWQAQLFNPGGFRLEYHSLRLRKPFAYVAMLFVVAAVLLPGDAGRFARDIALVVLVLYVFHGIALIHGVVGLKRLSGGWLFLLYLLILLAMPQTLLMLALLGYGDTWLDFRARIASAGNV